MAENIKQEPSKLVETDTVPKTKTYKRRWYILILYVLYVVCNSAQWLQYSIVSSAVKRFYGVTNWHVNLTSLVMMGAYVVLALPAAWLMDMINLRWTAILGALGTAIGSWIKLFSAHQDGFYVTLFGQLVVAVAQVLMLAVPQKLSSIWFGSREVSSACSIGVFGFQLGIVVGFFVPPVLVKNHDDLTKIGAELSNMFLYFSIASTTLAVLVLFTFQDEPRIPPSLSQARVRQRSSTDKPKYTETLKRLFSQRTLVALFITSGINNGCFNGFSTLLSQIFLEYFPGQDEDAGNIGVTMVISGMVASVTFGYILDKTKRFKFVLIFIYYMSAVAMACFTVAVKNTKSLWTMYGVAGFVGTFLCGYTAVSFDVATELTYPESELIVGTIMNMSSLLFTFAATVLFGLINETCGYFWGNIGFVITLFVGATCTLPIRFEHKRTNAQKSKMGNEEEGFLS